MKVAFYKGDKTIFDRMIRWWTHGDYSHCELLITEKEGFYLAGTATPFSGVTLEWKKYNVVNWDIIDCHIGNPLHAQLFFEKSLGAKYDYLGIFGFIFRRGQQKDHRWFCSEAIAAGIGLKNPWRYCPNTLYDILVSVR